MLTELRIHGLGVIAEARIPLEAGLTVVTGETGAGKTMVVTGLSLLFGGRGDSSRVRPGVDRAWIEGRLHAVEGPAGRRAVEAGAEPDDDGSLLLARALGADGRSRAVVGGRSVPVAVLAELAADVVAIHGQSDQSRLLRPAEQRAALDRYGGAPLAAAAVSYAAAYDDWRAAEAALQARTRDVRVLADEADRLRTGLQAVTALDPQPGEEEALAVETRRLENAASLQTAATLAHAALAGDLDGSAVDRPDVGGLLAAARSAVSTGAPFDPVLAALDERLGEVSYLVADLAAELATYAAGIEADPVRLDAVHERRAALSALVRRYADDLDGLLAWRDEAARRLLDLDLSDEAVHRLTRARDAGRDRAGAAAAELRAARVAAADRFAAAVSTELTGLAMPAARVEAVVRPRPVTAGQPELAVAGDPAGAGPDGCDDVEILLTAHRGAPARPLQRGASGGELSRVMLAVEVVLAGSTALPLLVFDEVDAGVGGRAATEVGRRLARLARGHQVVVVTHLAQVAAFADSHLVVDKDSSGSVTDSALRRVTGTDRVAELARMLAGQDESAHAREHARELLAQAAAAPGGPDPVPPEEG